MDLVEKVLSEGVNKNLREDIDGMFRNMVKSILFNIYDFTIEQKKDAEISSSFFQLYKWASNFCDSLFNERDDELMLTNSADAKILLQKLSKTTTGNDKFDQIIISLLECFPLWGDDVKIAEEKTMNIKVNDIMQYSFSETFSNLRSESSNSSLEQEIFIPENFEKSVCTSMAVYLLENAIFFSENMNLDIQIQKSFHNIYLFIHSLNGRFFCEDCKKKLTVTNASEAKKILNELKSSLPEYKLIEMVCNFMINFFDDGEM